MSVNNRATLHHSFYDITPLLPLIDEGRVLLTPNKRLARRLVSEWNLHQQRQGSPAWETLPAAAMQHWLLQQWRYAVKCGLAEPFYMLSGIQERQLWCQVIERSAQLGKTRHIMNSAGAAELASKARTALIEAQVPLESAAVQVAFTGDADCSAFLHWSELFDAELARLGLCTAADCLKALSSIAAELPPVAVALVSFEDISPLLQSILSVLCADAAQAPDPQRLSERTVAAFNDKRAELNTIAKWAHDIHRCSAEETVGIVVDGDVENRLALEYLLRREFDCLGENYNALPVNFSSGLQLSEVPIVRDALLALSFTGHSVATEDVVAVLHSPFLNNGDVHAACSQHFIKRLYDEGAAQWSLSDLRYFADRHAGADGQATQFALHERLAATATEQALGGKKNPSQWVVHIHATLQRWGWPGTRGLDSLEYQQLKSWYDVVDSMRQMDVIVGAVDLQRALQLLRLLCEEAISQPLTQDSSIQVLGPLEAAGLQFDHLWLSGMQASNWPGPARPNPFIPHSLQVQYALPRATPDSEQSFARALFQRFCHSAHQLTASYCKQDNGVPELPSALLASFSPGDYPAPATFPGTWQDALGGNDLECLTDDQAPAVVAAEAQGGSRLLEDQSHCPFRAFANWRLGVQALPGFGVGLSPAARGSLLHDALQVLWSHLHSHAALMAASESSIESALQYAIDQAVTVAKTRKRSGLGAVYWQLEAQRTFTVLQEWLLIEQERAPFVVHSMEQDYALQIGGLQLGLRVDRIDELEDGSVAIIDYKSGRSSASDWLGERPSKPQLLLYGLAVPELAGALAFGQVRARECSYVGIGASEGIPGVRSGELLDKLLSRSGEPPADWQALNERWQTRLLRLANEYLQGNAAVDPLSSASCLWCGLQPLCRVDRELGDKAEPVGGLGVDSEINSQSDSITSTGRYAPGAGSGQAGMRGAGQT